MVAFRRIILIQNFALRIGNPEDEGRIVAGATVGKGDIEKQCAQVYANIHTALRAVGADWGNVVQFTSFLVREQDAAAFRAWRGREFPKMFPGGAPPNTLLIISRLADPDYLLEVQTIAAL